MKRDYVLRKVDSASDEIRFAVRAKNHVLCGENAPVSVSILRRDADGYASVLFGDRVVVGFISKKTEELTLTLDGRSERFSLSPAAVDAMRQGLQQAHAHSGPVHVRSPIPGTLKAILVELHGSVSAGQTLAVLEAMKMENEIRAPIAGTVEKISAQPGQNLPAGAPIFILNPLPKSGAAAAPGL